MRQENVGECWKRLTGKMEEKVQVKYKVEDSQREAYKGRGAPSELRIVRRIKTYWLREWSEACWARILSWFREYNLQREQGMQEGWTEEEEMKQQQRMKVMKDVTR